MNADLSNIHSLFLRTLEGSDDDEDAWQAIRELYKIGSEEVFHVAAQWCASSDPLRRARGADVIAQLGKSAEGRPHPCPGEALTVLKGMLEEETKTHALSSGIFALGHLEQLAAVPVIIRYKDHQDGAVRYAVACALGLYSNEPEAIDVLIELMTDAEEDVRDWATFGLGVLGGADTPNVREALASRLSDLNGDVREEAVAGLAKRQDMRALTPLLQMLAETEVTSRILEAASYMLKMEINEPELKAHEYIAALKKQYAVSAPDAAGANLSCS